MLFFSCLPSQVDDYQLKVNMARPGRLSVSLRSLERRKNPNSLESVDWLILRA